MDTTATLESRIAYLSEHEDTAGTTIHGVALGEGDVANGKVNGEAKKTEWTREVLQEAAETLEGKPIIDAHSDDEQGNIQFPPPEDMTIGKFTDVGYEEGVGVIYEGKIVGEERAEKIEAGILDISPEVGFDADNPDGDVIRPNKAAFFGGAIVSVGAGPSNSVESGPNPQLATLSASGVSALLSSKPDDPEGEVSGDTSNEGAESSAETDTDTHMGDDPENDGQDVEALLERLEQKEERVDELEASLNEVQETNDELQSEVTEVKEAYAAALSEHSDGFMDEEELAENFDVATLRAKAEDLEVSVTPDTEPDTQTGAGETEDSLDVDEATLEEARDLIGRANMLESADEEYAATLREEAADKVGADDFDGVLEVLD